MNLYHLHYNLHHIVCLQCIGLFVAFPYSLSIVKKRIESENGQKVDMTRNYHNHILQNSEWHREEESKEKSTNNNSDKTFITPLHRHF